MKGADAKSKIFGIFRNTIFLILSYAHQRYSHQRIQISKNRTVGTMSYGQELLTIMMAGRRVMEIVT